MGIGDSIRDLIAANSTSGVGAGIRGARDSIDKAEESVGTSLSSTDPFRNPVRWIPQLRSFLLLQQGPEGHRGLLLQVHPQFPPPPGGILPLFLIVRSPLT